MHRLTLYRPIIATVVWGFLAIAIGGCIPIKSSSQAQPESPSYSDVTQPNPNQPKSAIIEQFIEQIDGEFGYQILRPANWEPIHLGTVRGYRSSEATVEEDRLLLTIMNLEVLAANAPDTTQVGTWLEFQQSDSFEAWMEKREAAWTKTAQTVNLSFERYKTLPNGALYVLMLPDQKQVQLIAYIVDDISPLVVSLEGFGAYAQVNKLEEEGILDDFLTMLQSAQAINPDPELVNPPLPH